MIDPEFLYAVAQVGVTYAGFSTLVSVVAYRRELGALPARIYYMLLLSIIVVVFAFVPAVVRSYGTDDATTWKLSSVLFGMVWLSYWIHAIRTLTTRFPVWNALSWVNKFHTAVVHPGSAAALLLGSLGLWGSATPAVYVTALLIMLYMSAYLFLQIIVGLLEDSASSGPRRE